MKSSAYEMKPILGAFLLILLKKSAILLRNVCQNVTLLTVLRCHTPVTTVQLFSVNSLSLLRMYIEPNR